MLTETDLKDLVGKTVSTPDGQGKVTKVGDRYVHIDLKDKSQRQFDPRELTVVKESK